MSGITSTSLVQNLQSHPKDNSGKPNNSDMLLPTIAGTGSCCDQQRHSCQPKPSSMEVSLKRTAPANKCNNNNISSSSSISKRISKSIRKNDDQESNDDQERTSKGVKPQKQSSKIANSKAYTGLEDKRGMQENPQNEHSASTPKTTLSFKRMVAESVAASTPVEKKQTPVVLSAQKLWEQQHLVRKPIVRRQSDSLYTNKQQNPLHEGVPTAKVPPTSKLSALKSRMARRNSQPGMMPIGKSLPPTYIKHKIHRHRRKSCTSEAQISPVQHSERTEIPLSSTSLTNISSVKHHKPLPTTASTTAEVNSDSFLKPGASSTKTRSFKTRSTLQAHTDSSLNHNSQVSQGGLRTPQGKKEHVGTIQRKVSKESPHISHEKVSTKSLTIPQGKGSSTALSNSQVNTTLIKKVQPHLQSSLQKQHNPSKLPKSVSGLPRRSSEHTSLNHSSTKFQQIRRTSEPPLKHRGTGSHQRNSFVKKNKLFSTYLEGKMTPNSNSQVLPKLVTPEKHETSKPLCKQRKSTTEHSPGAVRTQCTKTNTVLAGPSTASCHHNSIKSSTKASTMLEEFYNGNSKLS